MKIEFTIEINHPVFGDNCQVNIKCEYKYITPNFQDGCLESPDGFEFESIEILEINDKKYAKPVMDSISFYITNNYAEKLKDSYIDNYIKHYKNE